MTRPESPESPVQHAGPIQHPGPVQHAGHKEQDGQKEQDGRGEQDGRIAGWDVGGAGVVRFPSGLLVRGRGLRHPLPSGHPPTFGVYLLGRPPPEFGWASRWVRWPDFRLPSDPAALRTVLAEIRRRARAERVEVACGGGRGRTGTALACLAVLDGVPAGEAVAFIRRHYDPRAVETPWQRRFVRAFTPD
jgi:hypothetical protein